MRKLLWFVWHRPRMAYSIDRAFGWSRIAAAWRCWQWGRKLLYPPVARREMRRQQEAQEMRWQMDRDQQQAEMLASLKAARDAARGPS